MTALMQELLSVLEAQGFCYHSLRGIAQKCDRHLANRALGDRSADIVAVFVIGRGCDEVAQRFDIGPVTTEAHDHIAGTVRPALEAAIKTLGSAQPGVSTTALGSLISAIRQP